MTDATSADFGRRWHDMGGDPAGAINRDEHDYALWEKRVDALMVIASKKGYFTVDGLRRHRARNNIRSHSRPPLRSARKGIGSRSDCLFFPKVHIREDPCT